MACVILSELALLCFYEDGEEKPAAGEAAPVVSLDQSEAPADPASETAATDAPAEEPAPAGRLLRSALESSLSHFPHFLHPRVQWSVGLSD